jgi:hypothetical protein
MSLSLTMNVVGVDGTYEASLSNIARFSTESVSPFIPYEDLTEEIVIGWIQTDLGVDGVNNLVRLYSRSN